MGKASFAELMDTSGRIQLYVNRDEICPGEDKELYNTVFKKLLDLGDFIGVKGRVFKTQVGETSVHVTELKLLAKALRPLPVVKEKRRSHGEKVTYDAFTDPEQRYRQRYVDMVVNPQRARHLHQAHAAGAVHAQLSSTTKATWRWKRRFCSRCTAARRRVRSKRTTTRWT